MTRIAVLSDVHGNLPAMEMVLTDIHAQVPDATFHAGDMVNGPSSREILELLRMESIPGVFGNHEEYVLNRPSVDSSAHEVEKFGSSAWTRAALPQADLREIKAWPLVMNPVPGITIVHGSPTINGCRLAPETTDAEVRAEFDAFDTPVVVAGHTHRTHVRKLDGRLFVNVGSAGRAIEGGGIATWGLFTRDSGSWDVEIRRVTFDTKRALADAIDSGWLEASGGVGAAMLHEITLGQRFTRGFSEWWDTRCPERPSVDAYRDYARATGVDPLV